ncbi:MAG: hypothetical protein ACTHK2_01930 [Dokdonella sp.]|uniref:hypothetical protein n=1 Tax=Dokdonella sp. TaxID=2291710 RepID=UPI003F7DB1FF
MSAPAWPRPEWRDGGDEAFLLWFVFGTFDPGFVIDAHRYRTRGTPPGIDVVRYENRALARWDGYPLAGTLGRLLWEEDARLFERATSARDCTMLRGSIRDPANLDPLRDLVGTITALVDGGGVAVVDPQILSMFDATQWRERFTADVFRTRDHVLILCSDDERNAGRSWVHTRGMRKFARPDISIRNVPPAAVAIAGELAERFAEFQAMGGIVDESREVEVDGVPHGMRLRVAGAPDDPEFNNRHVALDWPV